MIAARVARCGVQRDSATGGVLLPPSIRISSATLGAITGLLQRWGVLCVRRENRRRVKPRVLSRFSRCGLMNQ
jgi:hypothetical protein